SRHAAGVGVEFDIVFSIPDYDWSGLTESTRNDLRDDHSQNFLAKLVNIARCCKAKQDLLQKMARNCLIDNSFFPFAPARHQGAIKKTDSTPAIY
ncbi:MAG TPA: hypothetical protein PK461_16910, partial [Alcaligenes faecalis]|nr:hypothetical protein [Alcaligenes faecalis]